jgi:hypothetical protein
VKSVVVFPWFRLAAPGSPPAPPAFQVNSTKFNQIQPNSTKSKNKKGGSRKAVLARARSKTCRNIDRSRQTRSVLERVRAAPLCPPKKAWPPDVKNFVSQHNE